ncbi:MAG: tetratricopeptide repeat protein [Anaerolineae bacterium]|nr:tetratricopeptide repeat protein [Anaerolineae bacterium]
MTTLSDVHSALNQENYRLAAAELQEVLRTDPSADAWYMAAELTLDQDRDRAIRHLKRALLLDPRHGNSRTLLGQLGESPDFTMSDVAEEVADVFVSQTSQTPGLKRLPRQQRLLAVGAITAVTTLVLVIGLSILFRPTGPAYIPAEGPKAQAVQILNADTVFTRFTGSSLQMFGIERISDSTTPGKQTLKFTVPGTDGLPQAVQVIVYSSISDLVRDQNTQQGLEASSEVVASGNVVMAYPKGLQGMVIESQLVRQFQVITGA